MVCDNPQIAPKVNRKLVSFLPESGWHETQLSIQMVLRMQIDSNRMVFVIVMLCRCPRLHGMLGKGHRGLFLEAINLRTSSNLVHSSCVMVPAPMMSAEPASRFEHNSRINLAQDQSTQTDAKRSLRAFARTPMCYLAVEFCEFDFCANALRRDIAPQPYRPSNHVSTIVILICNGNICAKLI